MKMEASLAVWLDSRKPALIAGPSSGWRVPAGPGWCPVFDAVVVEGAVVVVETVSRRHMKRA